MPQAAAPPPGKPPRPPLAVRLTGWVFILLLLLLPIAACEIYFRAIGLGSPIIYYTNASYRFAPMPNQHERRRRGAQVTIDSRGLRGVRDWSAPADARILFVGDSVTYGGSYIDDRQTFAAATCLELERELARRITCGNAGVNAYGTDNMAERILYTDVKGDDLLVVTLIAGDTVRGLSSLPNVQHAWRPGGLLRGWWEVCAYLVARLGAMLDPPDVNLRHGDDLAVSRQSLRNLWSAIRLTHPDPSRVLIVFSPARDPLAGRDLALAGQVRADVAASGFPYLDMTAPVAAAAADRSRKLYYDGVHLEVDGHRLYAERIAGALRPILGGKILTRR